MENHRDTGVPISPAHLKRLTFLILAAGFIAAIVVYITAAPEAENPLGYEPLENKKFLHDMELYGGKINILAAQFNNWFFGLWHGKNLAYTIAVITILTVLVVRFIFEPVVSETKGEDWVILRQKNGP